MKRQVQIAIEAVEVAKQAITQIRCKMAEGDARLDKVEDAEMATGWIIKTLREIESVRNDGQPQLDPAAG